jgi:uncharacterized protein YegL
MRGNKIRSVNRVMRDTIKEIRGVGGSDSLVEVAIMSFSTGYNWMYPAPVSIEDFEWKDMVADGWTNLGMACLELDSKMSRNGFLRKPSLSYAPVVILLSDGGPTDKYEKAIYQLNSNKWFRSALKIAFAIGEKANVEKLSLFTGDPNTVIRTGNEESFTKLLKFVTIKSSEIATKSGTISDHDLDDQKHRDFVRELNLVINPEDLSLDYGW